MRHNLTVLPPSEDCTSCTVVRSGKRPAPVQMDKLSRAHQHRYFLFVTGCKGCDLSGAFHRGIGAVLRHGLDPRAVVPTLCLHSSSRRTGLLLKGVHTDHTQQLKLDVHRTGGRIRERVRELGDQRVSNAHQPAVPSIPILDYTMWAVALDTHTAHVAGCQLRRVDKFRGCSRE